MPATAATVRSYLDAGGASLWAGSVDRGLEQLRLAVSLAQRTGDSHLVAESLVTLSGALIHQAGGRGAEVADLLHRALQAEGPDGASRTAAAAYRELGYLSVQRGVPDRAAGWLDQAMRAADGFPTNRPGSWPSRACWPRTLRVTARPLTALTESGTARQRRREPPAAGVQRGPAGPGAPAPRRTGPGGRAVLDRAQELIAEEHWTAFEPFVAGVRGETYLAAGELEEAAAFIDRSWVMAELAGDHCYMALAAGAEARLFAWRTATSPRPNTGSTAGWSPSPGTSGTRPGCWTRPRRSPSPSGLPAPPDFVDRLGELASRSGMREFLVRAQSHRAVLGDEAAAEAVPWLAKEIDNPALDGVPGGAAAGV